MDQYIDDDGWIGHLWENGPQPLEFGDGALRFGQYHIAEFLISQTPTGKAWWVEGFSKGAYCLLSGVEPVRRPGLMWWGQAGTMSRDNLYGLIDGASILGDELTNKVLWAKLKKRFFFTWNTKDI